MERSKTSSHEDKALNSEGPRMPRRPHLTWHEISRAATPILGVPRDSDIHVNSYRALHLPSAMLFFQIRNQKRNPVSQNIVLDDNCNA